MRAWAAANQFFYFFTIVTACGKRVNLFPICVNDTFSDLREEKYHGVTESTEKNQGILRVLRDSVVISQFLLK